MTKSPHFDQNGQAHMVDVSRKAITVRRAVASGIVAMLPETANVIRAGQMNKGDVLAVSRLAAIQATKLTQQLIPLCHAIPIESVSVDFQWQQASDDRESILCRVTAVTTAKTGIEMEAMTGVSVACLTIYDMIKSIDRAVSIGPIQLEEKSGGKSGTFVRE